MRSTPPNRALKFLRWFCREDYLEEIEGDLTEIFELQSEESPKKARRRFTWSVIRYFRPEFIKSFRYTNQVNTVDMFRNYFKVGWRHLLNQKGYAFINISGLAIGMAVAILIGLWVWDELSYNKYHEHYDRIAKVIRQEGENTNDVQTTGMGTLLKNEYETQFDLVTIVRARLEERALVYAENSFLGEGYFMQPDGPEMFSLNMIRGSRQGLEDMNSILLSKSLANKLFNEEDPLNKIVRMDDRWDLKVTGVYEDLPRNSEFYQATYFAPLDLYLNGWSSLNVWDNYNMNIYVQIKKQTDFKTVSGAIKNSLLPHLKNDLTKPQLFLHPMSKWHLYSEFDNGKLIANKNLQFVWFMGITGVLVLILASINFMNLNTARSEKRAREVGIRKTIGSVRRQLISQFLTESFIVVLISFVLAIFIVMLVLPWFNNVTDKELKILWSDPTFWMISVSFILLTSVLSGSYPAFFLSSFSPLKVLKGAFHTGIGTVTPRKVLVVVQFTISISLIIGAIIIYQQIQFTKNRPIGYAKDALLTLPVRSPELKNKYETLRNELKSSGMAIEIAMSNYPITSSKGWNTGFEWPGKSPDTHVSLNVMKVTPEYGETIGLEFVNGRDFSREIASDKSAIIINEAALRLMNLKNPVGKEVDCPPILLDERKPYTIIGVIKDMIKGSPYESAFPSILFYKEHYLSDMFIRLNPNANPSESIAKIENIFHAHLPSVPFDYRFVDDIYNDKFKAEEQIGNLAGLFTVLAISISCLGLFGLAAFVAEQRTKEIGIRKVMGASVINLWKMLTREFLLLVIISSIISIPISYYILHNWLQNYEYRININIWVFILAGATTLIITLLTVSYQSIKAAVMSPVNSLRSE